MRWIILVVACVPIAFAWYFHTRWPKQSDVLADIGAFMTGAAAMLVAVFAAVEGVRAWKRVQDARVETEHKKQETETRKQDQSEQVVKVARDDRVAEIAGRTIITGTKFADALHVFATPLVMTGEPEPAPDQPYSDHLAKVYEYRFDRLRPVLKEFQDASELAEAYLPSHAVTAIRDLWDLYSVINVNWHQFAREVRQPGREVPRPGAQERMMEAEGRVQSTLDALRTELRKITVIQDNEAVSPKPSP